MDLFSGAGAMSLGAMHACQALGKTFKPVLAIDNDDTALGVYADNFGRESTMLADVSQILDRPLGASPSRGENVLRRRTGRVDLLIGGPPCQGHSDLNNHTRRNDPKNLLYERMARFAELLRPKHILIENVPAVQHDRRQVVEIVKKHLDILGYSTAHGVLRMEQFGVPQRRSRHVLVATRIHHSLASVFDSTDEDERSVRWAIEDLESRCGSSWLDTPSKPSEDNRRRIAFLFRHDAYDLPDHRRPACHRTKPHSYKSVYGRLNYDEPAQTITSGFGSMGQGRFVHPAQRRTLTPHEAARLQMIPDYFDLSSVPTRRALAEIIGNAVPPKFAYALVLELLR